MFVVRLFVCYYVCSFVVTFVCLLFCSFVVMFVCCYVCLFVVMFVCVTHTTHQVIRLIIYYRYAGKPWRTLLTWAKAQEEFVDAAATIVASTTVATPSMGVISSHS